MSGKNHISAIKNKAVAAVAIISVVVLLYIFTAGTDGTTVESKKRDIDVSKCETAQITMAEVLKHNKCSLRDYENNDYWLAIEGYVFDVTEWILQHPGGDAMCVIDPKSASGPFRRSHGDWENLFTTLLKPKYCIGRLVNEA